MFSQEIVGLHDDGFEGSNDELRISQEVFYGNVAGVCSKRCAATGVSNSVSKEDKIFETSVCSHSENSVVVNLASSKDLCLKDADAVMVQRDCGVRNSLEESIVGARIDDNVHAKRIRLSVNELCNFKPYLDKAEDSSVPVKQVVSGMYHPVLQSSCQILMCHVVESSREGMASTCYLLKQPPALEREGNLGDGYTPNGWLSGSDGSEGKQVGVSKSVASPISQESSAMKVLVSSPSAQRVSKSGLLQRGKRRPKSDLSPQPEDDNVLLTSDNAKDSRALLRSRVFHLLKRAGWNVETRKRGCGRYRYFYRSPEGNLVREFRRVWNLCGQSLNAHGNDQVAVDEKHWTDVGQLWSDLYDTLRYIENKMNYWETKNALTHQWCLLNPFVILVLVDRKLHTLKAGNLVKEKQKDLVDEGSQHVFNCRLKSVEGYSGRSVDMDVKKIVCDPSLAFDCAVVDDGERYKQGAGTLKSRSFYVSEGNGLRLIKTVDNVESRSLETCTDENMHICPSHLPASVSDSTCLQYSSCLYDVPIDNADVNMIYEQFEASSPHQDSCVSSLSYNKWNLDSEENAKDVVHCSLERGKSEKFSKLELSKLCQAEADILQINGRRTRLKSVEIQDWPVDHGEHAGSSNKLSTRLFEHHSGSKRSRFRKSQSDGYRNSCCIKELNSINLTDEASLHLQNDSIESQPCRKGMKRKKNDCSKRKSMACQLKDDDLLISAIMKKKTFKSSKTCYMEFGKLRLKPQKKRKSQKGSCRLLPRSLGKGGKVYMERWSLMGERTVFSWLLSARAIFINEVIVCRDPKDDTVIKDGLIMKDGILCKCCNKVFSVTGFTIHAGFRQECPCSNLFMGSGRPYTLCQLHAWSAEYKARRSSNRSVPVDEFDKNDDSCGLCGDGGELLCCDNCPSTFHQSCLSAEELPEGSWYCLNCTCRLCGDLVNDNQKSSSNVALKCLQCERKFHHECLMGKDMSGVGGSPWFCGTGCEEVYGGLQSRIGLSSLIADDYYWTLLRCIHDDQKVPSPQHFALKAECNSKLAAGITIMEECFLSMTDLRTGIDMIPQVVYNWGSEFARLDYHGFYTAVLEKDDVLISIASIRVHGVAVAEMPLIATCSKYRRQGMCRLLLNSIEKMLISLKVEKLVLAAISDLVETWTVGFGFIPMEEEEKRSLSKINFMVFPGTVLLKKTLYVNQGTSLIEGTQETSSLMGESTKIEACLEGELVSNEVVCVNTAETSLEEDAGQFKAKPTIVPDIEAVDTHQDGKASAGMEPELLSILGSSECEDKETTVTDSEQMEQLSVCSNNQAGLEKETGKAAESTDLKLCSGGITEADVCMSSQVSGVGSGMKLDDNLNLHVIEQQNNCLKVIKHQEAVETTQYMEFSTVQEVMEPKLDSIKENRLSNCTEECLTQETHTETPSVTNHVESRIVEVEATSDLQNRERGEVGATESLSAVNNQSGNSMPMWIEEGGKESEAAGYVAVRAKPDDQLEPQGMGSIFSMQKGSSDECVGPDVPILVRGEVSGTDTV